MLKSTSPSFRANNSTTTTTPFTIEVPPVKESLQLAAGGLLGLAVGTVAGGPLGIIAGVKLAKEHWVK